MHHDKSAVDSIYTQNNTNQKHMLHSESSVFIRIHLCVCRWIQITWEEWFNTAGWGNMVDEHVRMKMKLLSAESVGMQKINKNKMQLHVLEQTNLPYVGSPHSRLQLKERKVGEVFRGAGFWSRWGLVLKHKMSVRCDSSLQKLWDPQLIWKDVIHTLLKRVHTLDHTSRV